MGSRLPMRALVLSSLALAAALSTSGATAGTQPLPLQPYRARYEVSYRGLIGGQIAASLQPEPGQEHWTYETHAFPNMLGRLAISSSAHERGTMEITPDGVRPLVYEYDDGKSGSAKDIRLTFDWGAARVTGLAEGRHVALELAPGAQDTASVQAAVMLELAAGRSPTGFRIVMKDKVREYRYWNEGRQRVETPMGSFDAVVWANQRDGSSRVTKSWHAPELGFVPVQALQLRDGKAEMQMRLIKLER